MLFGGYTLYGRMREALNPDFRPFLYAEIMRPVTFAAKTVAYAVRATHGTHGTHGTPHASLRLLVSVWLCSGELSVLLVRVRGAQ